MAHFNQFIADFVVRYNYPAEAIDQIVRVEEELDATPAFSEAMDSLVETFFAGGCNDIEGKIEELKALSEKYNENEFTLNLIFLLNAAPGLYQKYREAGISEDIYWNTMDDIRCKLLECIECRGVAGIFVPSWYGGFYQLDRFALGRFQYELRKYDGDSIRLENGRTLEYGAAYLNMHIPSSGVPLTDEIRFASYKRAYDFYRDKFPNGVAIFGCHSWLLYRKHKDFLPEKLNILRFINDFDIVESFETDEFNDAWRVFGRHADEPLDKRPRDTSLRAAYVDWLSAGNKAGRGNGYFMFDGERIIK